MIFTAPAKVNLYLEVVRRREDGYHDIETVFERVSIFDEISIEPSNGLTVIKCDDPSIPIDPDSLLGKTVLSFKAKSGARQEFSIELRKKIPIAAGMGGGSSDAATLLSGLNQMAGLPLSQDALVTISRRLGADVPFFLSGASFAYGRGRGDIIYPMKEQAEIWHIIVNPPFGVPTKEVYSKLSASRPRASKGHLLGEEKEELRVDRARAAAPKPGERLIDLTKERSVDRMFSAFLRKSDIDGIAENLRNDLQTIVLQDFPVLKQVFSVLGGAGAKGVLLSGSGPTVFGVFDRETAIDAEKKVRGVFKIEDGWRVFRAKTC